MQQTFAYHQSFLDLVTNPDPDTRAPLTKAAVDLGIQAPQGDDPKSSAVDNWGNCFRLAFKWNICKLLGKPWIKDGVQDQRWFKEAVAILEKTFEGKLEDADKEHLSARNPAKIGPKTLAWQQTMAKHRDPRGDQNLNDINADAKKTMEAWLEKYAEISLVTTSNQSMRTVILSQSFKHPTGIVTIDWSTLDNGVGGHVKAYYKEGPDKLAYFFDSLHGEYIEQMPGDAKDFEYVARCGNGMQLPKGNWSCVLWLT